MTRPKLYTADEVRTILERACAEHPRGQAGWAEQHGVSVAYVNDVLRRRRDPGPTITTAMGFERIERYRRIC